MSVGSKQDVSSPTCADRGHDGQVFGDIVDTSDMGVSVPWKLLSVVDQRREFVRLAGAGSVSFAELCRRFGIKRDTGYKWVARYAAEGEAGLVDRSRARERRRGGPLPRWRIWCVLPVERIGCGVAANCGGSCYVRATLGCRRRRRSQPFCAVTV